MIKIKVLPFFIKRERLRIIFISSYDVAFFESSFLYLSLSFFLFNFLLSRTFKYYLLLFIAGTWSVFTRERDRLETERRKLDAI